MLNKIFQRKILLSDIAVLVYISLIKLLIHILTGSQYGYFRDELYYIEASRHLDFGYVDIPPLVPLIMAINSFVFGTSLMAIHILPALAGAVTVFITGLTARKLGGGRFAQILAAVAFLTGGNWLVMNSMFTYDSFDQLMSAIFFYALIVILKDEKPKLWPSFGLIAGIGLMTKLSMMFIGFAMILGLLLTKERRQFTKKWIWIGGLVVILVCMPYILWQVHHGAPVLEYWKNYAEGKTLKSSPLEFILNQVADIGALSVPIWICGLYYFLFSKDGKKLRVLGLIYIILLVLFAAMHMKPYLLSPEYIVLFAAGGVVIESFISKIRWGWLKPVYLSLLVVLCIITAPLALPILPIDRLGSYMQMLGVKSQKIEVADTNDLPNHLIDRFGWEEMVKRVSDVYGGLSKEDRAKCAIFATNYGEAGAISFMGKKYNLPDAISGHLTYHIWGPGNYTGDFVIAVGLPESYLKELFQDVKLVDVINRKYCKDEENNLHIYICRKPKDSLKNLWPQKVKWYM